MYPAFPDVLCTLRENLMRELVPELTTDYAREQATGMLLLIEHLLSRWDRALEALREENEDLRGTLRHIDAEAGCAGASGAESRGDEGEAGRNAAGRGAELSAENRELRARLAAVIASAPDSSAALRLAEGFMVRQLARELAAVAVGALTWD
jgi:hypothetical protein